jgi:hypothetical protein
LRKHFSFTESVSIGNYDFFKSSSKTFYLFIFSYRIRQMLPDKSIASLVKFYYSWKKTRIRVLERQEKKKKGESENGSPDESDVEEKVIKKHFVIMK